MPTVSGLAKRVSATFARPADIIAYSVGDLVANSTSAAAVVPLALPCQFKSDGGFSIATRFKLAKSNNSITLAQFRVHLFTAPPTLANGDNGAILASGVSSYLGYADITMDQVLSDGAAGFTGTTQGLITLPSGDAGGNVYALIEARAAYAPVSAESFTLTTAVQGAW